MGKIIVRVEKGTELFGAWAENVAGIYGEGETVQETKESIMTAINAYKKYNEVIPKELDGETEIEWRYDIPSLLQYYSGIFTKAALERITGINQKQFFHYATGEVKPRPAQRKKISEALNKLGKELMNVNL